MMIFKLFFAALLFSCALIGPGFADAAKLRVLVMGDSLMAVNRMAGASVAQALADDLGASVKDHSMLGARYFHKLPISGAAGMRIDAQLRGGPWDYVVMNGGGNDLLFGCGCGACKGVMNRLIAADGSTGAIPRMVRDIRATGARVIYTGYMRTPGVTSPVEHCGPLGDELDRRLAAMAARDEGVQFLLLANLVKVSGDRSYHAFDLVHPSVKGSRAIAAKVAALIGG
jgi:acyl-CoA thioesterase-1